jgi:uncharacterized protein (TIGR02453 family)
LSDLTLVMRFLSELNLHNDRTWFQAHRDDYDRAKEEVEAFFFSLFPDLGFDRGSHKASFWFHRIYRDTRFSREKTPYKPWLSAVLDPGGRKRPGLPVYFHLQPGGESIVGGGLWQPEPEALKKFRLDMEDGPRAFLKILEGPEFRRYLHLVDGEKLKRVPKGFPEDHPAVELFKLKQVVAWRQFRDDEVTAPGFAEEVTATARALAPFLLYLEESAGLVAPRD